jgi:hypothetical protein
MLYVDVTQFFCHNSKAFRKLSRGGAVALPLAPLVSDTDARILKAHSHSMSGGNLVPRLFSLVERGCEWRFNLSFS